MEVIASIVLSVLSYIAIGYAYKARHSNFIIKFSQIAFSCVTFWAVLLGLLFDDYVFIIFIVFIHGLILLGKLSYDKKALKHKVELGDNLGVFSSDLESSDFQVGSKNKKKKITKSLIAKGTSNLADYRYVAFIYEDSQGKVTRRDVDVRAFDGEYITGFCHIRKQLRTFRSDRILNDEIILRNTGEVMSVSDWVSLI
ncbi:hypothetical protein KGV77_004233 [Escherichia coli]|nr:hypothetical protein [Escherichia coli]